jgi:Baculovirus F protein
VTRSYSRIKSRIIIIKKNEALLTEEVNKQALSVKALFNASENSARKTSISIYVLEQKLNETVVLLNDVTSSENNMLAQQKVNELFSYVLYTLDRYHKQQEKIYTTLINPNSFLTPDLISPDEFLLELTKISKTLSEELRLPFPVKGEHIFKYYHVSHVKVVAHAINLIFRTEIPLSSKQTFNLFKITGIPFKVGNNSYAVPRFKSNFIAFDKNQDNFLNLTENELGKCTQDDSTNLCHTKGPLRKNEGNYCEVHFFYNRQEPFHCADSLVQIHEPYWTALASENFWLYVLPRREKITIEVK